MSAQPVKRACDACHRRKVKCDGHNPCRNCGTATLTCTYNAIPQKKGPKGSRAKVISELRETQRQTSLLTKVQNRMQGVKSPPTTPRQLPTPGFVTGELVKDSLDFYFNHMYAQMPILDRGAVEQQVMYMEQNRDAYCMLTALTAFTMIQPGKSMPMPPDDLYGMQSLPLANITSSELLVEEVLRVWKGHEHLATVDGCVSLNSLVTNFFLFACNDSMDMHNKAWYHLREATTMILMSNMHKEQTYQKWEPAEAARRRRIFWLLFMTERAYALKHDRPVTLQATINLPTAHDDPRDLLVPQVNEFITQVTAFRSFDNNFIESWAKTRGTLSHVKSSSSQAQLDEVVRSLICQDPHATEVHVNLPWLKSTAWGFSQICDESYRLPPGVMRDQIVNMASSFPESQEVVKSGLIENLFEITSSLVDYLALQPASRNPFSTTPRDHLGSILNIVAAVRNGCNQFLPLLMLAVGDVLPRLANPMLQNPPEDAHLASIDIFDGFGNAGMAPIQMPMDTDYERKFSMVDYDQQFAPSGMHGSPPDSDMTTHSPVSSGPTPPDMSSHFVTSASSPGLMSPSMDFPHGLNDYTCSPMADMVMSPIGAPGGGGLGHHPGSRHGLAMTPPQMHAHNAMAHGMNGLSSPSIPGQQHAGATSIPSHRMGPGGGGGDMMNGMARQRPLPSMHQPNAYALPLPIHRNVGDFQPLQRVNPDSHASMGQLTGMATLDGSDMGFGNLQ
jgi:hypothetical protein